MSYEYEIICFGYDFTYDCFPDSVLFKCGLGPVQMQPRACSNAIRFGSSAGPLSARPLRLSVSPPWHQNRAAVVHYSISGISQTALAPPIPRIPIPIDLFATILLTRRMQV